MTFQQYSLQFTMHQNFVISAPYDWVETNPTLPWRHNKLQAGRVFRGNQESVRTRRGRFDIIASAGAGSSQETRASNEPLANFSQSRRRPLLVPGWKHLLVLSHLRNYAKNCTVSISGLEPDSPQPQPWQSEIVTGNKDDELYSQRLFYSARAGAGGCLVQEQILILYTVFIFSFR